MDKFDELRALMQTNRSIRRFDNTRSISTQELERLVELTRFCASGRNLQPLRYRLVSDREECDRLFPALAWAGYYQDWDGPEPDQRPTAYLVQCLDTDLCKDCLCDDGLQLEAITLGARAMGISGCIIKAFNRQTVMEALNLPERYAPRYVLALGYAAEEAKIVDINSEGDYKYFRDADDTQCVPKRPLSELIIG